MRIHWLQHADFEGLGSIEAQLIAAGHSITGSRLQHGETPPDVTAFDALIVMGGPMNIYEYAAHPWLRTEKALIRDAIAQGRWDWLGIAPGMGRTVTATTTPAGNSGKPPVTTAPGKKG